MEPRSKMLDFFPRPITPWLTPDFLAGGGEMGERIRAHDWMHTALGCERDWPQGLRTAVRIMLASRQPMSIWWGAELTVLYNDACRALIGGNHPAALGQPAPGAWREIWDDMSPRVEGAILGNGHGADQPVPLLIERHGRVEEAHYTITFTAMPGEASATGGVLCSFADVTRSVVFDRQMNVLESIAKRAAGATTPQDACERAAEGLGQCAADIPFAAIYLIDAQASVARLAASAGIARGHAAFPERIAIDGDCPWPFAEALAPGPHPFKPVMLVGSTFGPLPSGPWSRPPREAVVVSLGSAGIDGAHAVLIAALNPFRVPADDCRRFIELVRSQVAACISNALARAEERGAVDTPVEIPPRKAAEAELAFTRDQLGLQVESLTQLHQLAMELGGISELEPALQRILDTAVEAQEADHGLVWLHDAQSGRLLVKASNGFDAAALELCRELIPGPNGGAARHAFANRRRWVIADTEQDPDIAPFREAARKVGFRSVHSTPIVTRSGALLGVVSVHHARPRTPLQREMQVADVCARHAADAIEAWRSREALRESERMYRAIGESMEYGVWTAGPDGANTFHSESFLKLTGLAQEETIGSGWTLAVHPADLEALLAKWKACLRDGSKWDHEFRVRGADGRWYAILGRAVPLRNGRGAITGWAGINLDIGRLKRVEDELRELDQRKNEFLATLAHELRNPLAPLRNGLEVMRLASGNPDMVEKARSMMERQLSQMVRLVDDLLDVSRVSRGRIELRRGAIELAAVLRNALETSQPLMGERRHQFIARIPVERIVLDGDMTRLSQVFWNLLNNAAKYTECGGRIALSVQCHDGAVEVSVKDSGIGIPAHMLPRVFDIFTQVDRSLEKSQGGLGIGLSIAKRLVEMHGGTIEARSEGHGMGSEFIVRLPARIEPAPDARPGEGGS